jgi:hypothetical protein
MKIAILGWGSLLWDRNSLFDPHHCGWEADGPELRLEFSQIAEQEEDGIALAIDPEHGQSCRVAYAFSKRINPDDAICDLRAREETTLDNIGYVFLKDSRHQYKDPATANIIKEWAARKQIDVVVWTDTRSNFEQSTGKAFSVDTALEHIRSVPPSIKAEIADYVWKAPEFIDTPLRRALQLPPWFDPTD